MHKSVKGFGDGEAESAAMAREKGDKREERGLVWNDFNDGERERDERPWREKSL